LSYCGPARLVACRMERAEAEPILRMLVTAFVPARGTPRRERRGDPVAGTQIRPKLDSRLRGNERRRDLRATEERFMRKA